jgi:ABC-type nitrate/sulfonate/bicarbonate transport system ATPase subunit
MLLDDVFSGMDGHTAELVSDQLLGPNGILRKSNATVILATHNSTVSKLYKRVLLTWIAYVQRR